MRTTLVVSRTVIALCALGAIAGTSSLPQDIGVQARIELVQAGTEKSVSGNLVLWLTPLPGSGADSAVAPGHFRMEQKKKNFAPHLLVVPLGSTVEFPNLDPFFHNVFSQFNGKRFDLGLYEAGSTREVHFDHEGISYLFCNIHSQMAAVIVTLRTPYYASATKSGVMQLRNVPSGDYEMHVWAEGADPKRLEALTHRVHIAPAEKDLGEISVSVAGAPAPHKNKFGEDYKPDPIESY